MDVSSSDIAKFIFDYPEIDNPNFIYEITQRKEFNELKLSPQEEVPEKAGIPLMSQELQARFFSPHTDYMSGLLFHGMGTGKTCTSSLIVEHFKSVKVNDKPRRRALVFVPNEDLERSYRKQVAYQCASEEVYIPQFTKEEIEEMMEAGMSITEMTEMKKEVRMRKLISETYDITTYEKFFFKTTRGGGVVKTVPRLSRDDEEIRALYSNRVIIIDEAHNLRKKTKDKDKRSMYEEMFRFLHTVDGCKIILLTGTPIWDKASEFAGLMNLILPLNKQFPIGGEFMKTYYNKDGKFKEDKMDEFKNMIRGKISYLRPMTTTAKKIERGVKEPLTEYVTVYPCVMSEFQYQYSEEAASEVEIVKMKYRTKEGGVETKEREIKGGSIRKNARDAANFVFPIFDKNGSKTGGSYGTTGFNENIESYNKGKNYRYKNQKIRNEIKNNLSMYSTKFSAIIELIKNNPTELVFIYNEFVVHCGGIINLALVLQEHGFVWAKNAKEIETPSDKKRFVAITSNKATTHESKKIEDVLTSFNAVDNSHGERCQIIIGSKKIGLGLNIKHIRQVHVVMPHWNLPSISQALFRAFRLDSHISLPENERYVNVYYHVAVKSGKHSVADIYPPDAKFSSKKTIDVDIYNIAETKESYNTPIYRLTKEISWDCALAYERNVLETDVNDTRECDYQECNYRCDNYPTKYINKKGKVWKYSVKETLRNTYDEFYSAEKLNEIGTKIIELFGFYFVLRIDMILKLINVQKRSINILLRSLDYLISTKVEIKNRYGFYNYLKEKGNVYFLSDDIDGNNISSSIYPYHPMVYSKTSISDTIKKIEYKEDLHTIDKICKNMNYENILELHYVSIILLIEYLISNKNQKTKKLLEKFNNYIIDIGNGNYSHNMYSNDYLGKGLPPSQPKILDIVRIYDSSKGVWKTALPKESIKVVKVMKKEKKKEEEIKKDIWENNPYGYYGFRDDKGKFKIREKETPGQRPTKGSVCMESAWSKTRIFDMLAKNKILPEPSDKLLGQPRDKLVDSIKAQPELSQFNDFNKYTDEELSKILTLKLLSKSDLCNLIEEWLKSKNLFYDTEI